MLQKSGRRGRALRPCFCERNERRKKRRKAAGENVFHAGELVLPADRCARRKCRRFRRRLCSKRGRRRAARTGRRGRGDKPEQPQDKKDFSPTKKKHPVRAGIRAGCFRRRAGRVCPLDRGRPKAADRRQRGDFAQSGKTRMCLRMALRGGVASGFGESRTRGLA